jgi:hypothetical protein
MRRPADITSGADPTSLAGQAVAAHLIGAICTLINNEPATVFAAVPTSLKTGRSAWAIKAPAAGVTWDPYRRP